MKKNVKLFSCFDAFRVLREQARAGMVRGFYGRHGRHVQIRKALYIMGYTVSYPFRKK